MFSIYNNNFTATNVELAGVNTLNMSWLALKDVASHDELSTQYAQVCQQYTQAKKWILIINPNEASLEQLAKTHGIDTSKVLCVNLRNKDRTDQINRTIDLSVEQIKGVLCRGNCSAVILSNASFAPEEIAELTLCAQQGETQCVLLKNNAHNKPQVH
ncbi:hypothetical protein GCM10009111_29690 [Colwellia asteriadis]|uniref:Cell division inhibitor SulA n=1 Tax=Colwellia asteriadis TaxID=517723 RepID=A0ABN1LA11_9GAMM